MGHRVGAVDVGKVGVGAEVLLRITFAKAKNIFKLDFFFHQSGETLVNSVRHFDNSFNSWYFLSFQI